MKNPPCTTHTSENAASLDQHAAYNEYICNLTCICNPVSYIKNV
jgi:hypothetical protein